MKFHKRFFRRYGDDASSRFSNETIKLSDGTEMYINIELTFFPRQKVKNQPDKPKRINWYISVASKDKNGRIGDDWNMWMNHSQIKVIEARARALKNKLSFLGWRQRELIIKSWFRTV